MPGDLSHLSEKVVSELMGGLLLSYFRSMHPERTDLDLIRNFRIPGPRAAATRRVDFAIFDRSKSRPVALFELVTTTSSLRNKSQLLNQLKRYADTLEGPSPLLAIVVPDSISKRSTLRDWSKKHDFEVVSYPD